jgi:hypothetical protein
MIPNETLEALIQNQNTDTSLLRLLLTELQRERRWREELQVEVARLRRSIE